MLHKFSSVKKTIIIITILCLTISLLVFFLFMHSWSNARDYQEDLVIDIPNSEAHLIIREWQFLLGSGAEVYYSDKSGNETVLDNTLAGGDDGYMPFADGQYEILFIGDTVTIKWFTGLRTQDGWETKSYELP